MAVALNQRGGLGLLLLCAGLASGSAAPKHVLYVTHSAGFRHDSIPLSQDVLRALGDRSGLFDVTVTEDLSLLNSDSLRSFDALFFFTSGELALTDQQKQDLLAFVRGGKGFGGVHSATDTLYSWPAYGELIGAFFDGHPWAQEVRIDVEEPLHPSMRGLAPQFAITDEIYQFRDFSRDRVRVLMTLDGASVDLSKEGVHRTDGDFALAWARPYGSGHVFYTALGHLQSTWSDPRFQRLIEGALEWLLGIVDGPAAPRTVRPAISDGGVADAFDPTRPVAAGAYVSLYGRDFTGGAQLGADPPALKLAGVELYLNGQAVPLLYVSPGQINAKLPADAQSGTLQLRSARLAADPVQLSLQ